MIFLALCILCSSAIFLIFRSFKIYNIDTFAAIVINYLVAGSLGLILGGKQVFEVNLAEADWTLNALILGFLFISLFYIMAHTAQTLGPSVSSVANKMALIVPVIFAVVHYGDQLNSLKICGIILALPGVYLSTVKQKAEGKRFNWKLLVLPLVLFLGSGFIDTFIKYTQEYHLKTDPLASKLFASFIFLVAFSIGLLIISFRKGRGLNSYKTWLGGLILGLVNYGSIYFLILTFNHSNLESSVVFPINNMGVVLLTSISSFFLFKEEFSIKNKAGIMISLLSILLITLS